VTVQRWCPCCVLTQLGLTSALATTSIHLSAPNVCVMKLSMDWLIQPSMLGLLVRHYQLLLPLLLASSAAHEKAGWFREPSATCVSCCRYEHATRYGPGSGVAQLSNSSDRDLRNVIFL
jgi:hypothetical protein